MDGEHFTLPQEVQNINGPSRRPNGYSDISASTKTDKNAHTQINTKEALVEKEVIQGCSTNGGLHLSLATGDFWCEPDKPDPYQCGGYLKAWKDARSHQFFLIGSRGETAGNQSCKAIVVPSPIDITHPPTFNLIVKMPGALVDIGAPKFMTIENVQFEHGNDQVLAAVQVVHLSLSNLCTHLMEDFHGVLGIDITHPYCNKCIDKNCTSFDF